MHIPRWVRSTLWAAGVALLCALTASPLDTFAQTTNGRFVVTVKDPTGAVISGATVTVENEGTLQSVTGTTGGEGVYTTPLLPVGRYRISVEASGFTKSVLEGTALGVGQEYGVVVTLQVGGASDVVTVSGGDALIQSTNAEVRSSVTAKQTQELPLITRSPLALVQLQAGVSGNLANTNTTINGQRASTTIVTQDGLNIQDNFIRANAIDFSPNNPTVAGVGEVTIVTSNPAPDVGGSSAVRFVTPAGTSEYHGELFWFHRNKVLNANSFFNNAAGLPRPPFIRNQFGYQIGGPVGIPGGPKVKNLYFFSALEMIRQRQQSGLTTTVLTPDARRGVFTYLDNANQRRTIDLLALRRISIDPTIAALINRVPNQSNLTTVGDGLNTTGFQFVRSVPFDRDSFAARVDYNPNERHHLEFIYRWSDEAIARSDIDQTFNRTLQVVQTARTNFGVAAWVWQISPRISNELRAGANFTEPFFGVDRAAQRDFFVGGLPFTNPDVTFLPQGRDTQITSIIDNAAIQFGKHNVRFGGQIDFLRVRPVNFAGVIPTITIGQQSLGVGGNPTALTAAEFPGGINVTQLQTANSFLALYAGAVSAMGVSFNATSPTSGFVRGAGQVRDLRFNQFAGYVADQWRVHPRLTLNLALRYEYQTPLREANNFMLRPVGDGTSEQLLLDPNGTVDFVSKFFWRPDRNNFAPNVSFAWDIPWLGRQTVLRGGYAMAFVNDEAIRAADNNLLTNPGLSTTLNPTLTQIQNAGPRIANAGNLINTLLTPPAFRVPYTYAQQWAITTNTAFGLPTQNLQTPFYHQWNIAIERELTRNMVVTVRYVGNESTNLVRAVDLNQFDVRNNGFAADVARAQRNGFLALAATGVFNPAFNPGIPGSQPLTVFPLLAGGGLLTNATVRNLIQTGEAGALASLYVTNRLAGSVVFQRNPNTLAGNVLNNSGFSRYNALQVEFRRRFDRSIVGDFLLQANYTFSKVLTNTNGTGQTRFEALLDNAQPTLENARAPFDMTHSFKINGIYELPFGQGKTLDPGNGFLRRLVGGFQVGAFFEVASGPPFGIYSRRGTLNRVTAGTRGDLNTVNTTLTRRQLQDLVGIFRTPQGIFFINPRVINVDGRAVAPDGQAPFNGQVFFNPGPGEVGSLQRFILTGPTRFNLDFNIVKRTAITERVNTELRFEFFNALNSPIFNIGDQNVNATNFGRVTSTFNGPRNIQVAFKIMF